MTEVDQAYCRMFNSDGVSFREEYDSCEQDLVVERLACIRALCEEDEAAKLEVDPVGWPVEKCVYRNLERFVEEWLLQ